MHFRHISTKIQPKNLKQHFDWGAGTPAPLATPLNEESNAKIYFIHTSR